MMNRLLLPIALLSLPAAAQTALAGDWTPFVSKPGAFSIMLPGVPTADSTTMTTEGISLVMYNYKTQGDSAGYVVTYVDYPAAMLKGGTETEEFLGGVVHGMVTSSKGKVLESNPITINGNVGRDVRIEVPVSDIAPEGGSIRLRLYIVGNRMYQLGIFGRGNNAFSPKTMQFLDSFKLVGR